MRHRHLPLVGAIVAFILSMSALTALILGRKWLWFGASTARRNPDRSHCVALDRGQPGGTALAGLGVSTLAESVARQRSARGLYQNR